MFVKFDCGCVGHPLDQKNAVVIKPCDADMYGPEHHWVIRDMSGKNYTYLSKDENLEIHKVLDQLVYDGYRFREIRRLLG